MKRQKSLEPVPGRQIGIRLNSHLMTQLEAEVRCQRAASPGARVAYTSVIRHALIEYLDRPVHGRKMRQKESS